MGYLAKCWNKKQDCFANVNNGKCICLKNAKFGGKDCPFYKPASEVDVNQIEEDIKHYEAMREGRE